MREVGLEIDKAAISRCDGLFLMGERISQGMQIEAACARDLGLPVLDFTVDAKNMKECWLAALTKQRKSTG
jgi:hypothetical protein